MLISLLKTDVFKNSVKKSHRTGLEKFCQSVARKVALKHNNISTSTIRAKCEIALSVDICSDLILKVFSIKSVFHSVRLKYNNRVVGACNETANRPHNESKMCP